MRSLKCAVIPAMFCLALTKTAGAQIAVQPYLQNPHQDRMTVLWWTSGSEPNSRIEYGLDNLDKRAAATNKFVPAMKGWLHEVSLGGLKPETTYRYRAVSGRFSSRRYAFSTVKRRERDFRVAILGDGRTDTPKIIAQHRAVVNRAALQKPDLVFEVGDMVHNGSAEHWSRFYRRIITASDAKDPGSDLASRVPYHLVVGNHEIYLRTPEEYQRGKKEGGGYSGGNLHTAMARFKAFVSNPPNGSSDRRWEERYYTIKYSVATFIVLDANNTSDDKLDNHTFLNDGDTPDWHPGSEQHSWLVKQLEQGKKDSAFTFVMFHPSPYCRGVHGDPKDSQRGIQLRALDPLFRKHGVDAVITSHDHLVEHALTGPKGYHREMDLNDPRNLNYLVQGNSGQSSRFPRPGWESWMDILGNDGPPFFTTYFYDWAGQAKFSFFDLRLKNLGRESWRATFRTMQSDGKVFDEFSINRTDPLQTLKTSGQTTGGLSTTNQSKE